MPHPLVEKAQALTAQLNRALTWATTTRDQEVAKNYRLQKDLRRSIFQAKRLEVAAISKMCVGVYGASQAGKSYLVSVLAKKGSSSLTAVLGDREVDFLRTINPEGGKESTGLVTRFTTDRLVTPDNYPIKAKVLSELDLIKIFVNTFAYDILPDEQDDVEKDVQRISQVLASAESLPRTSSPIAIEDVYDLEEYCNHRFASTTRLQALKRADYWERVAQLLPNLGEDGRVKVVELLWDQIPAMTRSYRLFASELGRLGFPEYLYCSASALFDVNGGQWVRGAQSVINVSTLDQLGSTDGRTVDVLTDKRVALSVALSTMCGLISELIVPLKEKPHDFFDCTDLLDFPGARSRNARPKNNELLATPAVQVENFLRGKVAYLFDKYASDLELSAMLLCVGPSNQEVVGLAKLVEDWVEKTHGKSPEDREQLPNGLFLILTKFDQEFSQGAAKSADGTRWSTRLEASLLKPFGSHCHRTRWVNQWDSKGPFNNTYWLRNPNVDQFGLVQYAGAIANSAEIGFAPERVGHIAALRQEFVANPLVQQHFQTPSRAWDAGMKLNDGGIEYLVEGLEAICRPGVKEKQVDARITAIASERTQDLKKYFISGNQQDLIKEKRALAEQFLMSCLEPLQKQRLGELINFMFISDTTTQDIFRRVENQYEREKNASRPASTDSKPAEVVVDSALASLLGLSQSVVAKTTERSEPSTILGDFPDRFVLNFFSEWHSAMIQKAAAGNAEAYLYLDRELFVKVLHEMERAAKRTGLVERLKAEMRAAYQYKSSNSKGWMLQQTAILTSLFNQFLVRGGCGLDSQGQAVQIDKLDGTSFSIFAPSPDVTEIRIPEVAEDFSQSYFIDWLQAVQYTIRQNAEFMAEQAGDTASNRELGEILEQIVPTTKPMTVPNAVH